jgi:hypothetical protein
MEGISDINAIHIELITHILLRSSNSVIPITLSLIIHI